MNRFFSLSFQNLGWKKSIKMAPVFKAKLRIQTTAPNVNGRELGHNYAAPNFLKTVTLILFGMDSIKGDDPLKIAN